MIKVIIFDWDGVIVDSMPWIYKAMQEVLYSYGIEKNIEEVSSRFFQPRDDYYNSFGIDIIDKEELDRRHKEAIKKYKIQGVVTGAVASTYQASRIQKICNDLDINCFNPLWQKDQIELLNELIKNKFKFKIVKVAADGLNDSWLNKVIDKNSLQDLIKLSKKYRFNPAGEGGEYESEIISCPLFK